MLRNYAWKRGGRGHRRFESGGNCFKVDASIKYLFFLKVEIRPVPRLLFVLWLITNTCCHRFRREYQSVSADPSISQDRREFDRITHKWQLMTAANSSICANGPKLHLGLC